MEIVDDMVQNGGALVPISNWLLLDHDRPRVLTAAETRAAFSARAFDEKFSTMDRMVAGWIGGQMEPVDDQAMVEYRRFVQHCDALGLWEPNVEDVHARRNRMIADLGSIMDLNLIYAAADRIPRDRSLVLEVGGGYGRLAEAAINVFGTSIRYVMVDSVPGSLYYAKRYLEAACPGIRVGSYYTGDSFDLDRFECFVIPSWRFEALNTHTYDVCVNIESFQEMSQAHLDHYLGVFDEVTREGAVVYSSNAHDYLFRGTWNYPSGWRKAMCANTPRSWTPDHPTEVFVKSTGDWSKQNAILDAAHRYSLGYLDTETLLRKVGGRKAAAPIARYYLSTVQNKAKQALARRLDRADGSAL